LLTLAGTESAAPDARAAALESVAATRSAQHLQDFQALAETGPAPVRVAAVRAVATLAQPGTEPWAQKIVLGDAPNEVRVEALRLLSRSLDGLTAILDLAEKGAIPPELRTLARTLTNNAAPPVAGRRGGPSSPVAMRQRAAQPLDPEYSAIRARAAKVLPLPAARKIPTAFELDLSYAGKPEDGRKVFDTDAACAACHSLGGSRKLGPDLSAVGAKYGKQAMLDHIVSPSDAISHEYVSTAFTLKDGGEVVGLITEETSGSIVVQLSADQQRRLRPADIASRQSVRVSSMPEGLVDNLSMQQLADLLEFLATRK
jgi:putative heme-binding domain-containing protein